MLYFINEFTISVALTVLTTLITERSKQKSTNKNEPSLSDDNDEDEIFLELASDENDEDEPKEEDPADDELYIHLQEFISIMDALDDAIEEMVNEGHEEAQAMYEKFGNYYRTIIPYAELINTSSQMMFPDELKRNIDKFNQLVNQFINDIIGDIYDSDSIGAGVQLKYELDEINRLGKERLESWSGRPTFESVIIKITNEDSDET